MSILKRVLIIVGIISAVLITESQCRFFTSDTSTLQPSALPILQAGTQPSPRQMIDQTCGACHSNFHNRPAGDYSLNSGDSAKLPGAFATSKGINPFDVTNDTNPVITDEEAKTALIIQKPLEGGIAHGGIKLPASHPVIQLLISYVKDQTLLTQLNRPAPAALHYLTAANGADNVHEIIFTKKNKRPAGFRELVDYAAGGRIYRMKFHYNTTSNTITEGPTDLTWQLPATADAQNPSVSLDGTKVAFACKMDSGSAWQIYEVNSDGSGGLHQITSSAGSKLQPFYLPYQPDSLGGAEARTGEGGIGFISSLAGFLDEYETGPSYSLYVCDANGGHQRQIEFNPSNDFHPWLHSSGMLIFTRWEHNEHQGHNFMTLFHISASDYESAGTNLFAVFGEHYQGTGNSFHEASEVLDSNYGNYDKNFDLLNLGYKNGGADPSNAVPGAIGRMIYRKSMRDDEGGRIEGPIIPRMHGSVSQQKTVNVLLNGDFFNPMKEKKAAELVSMSSVTYRQAHSLLNGLYVVSFATAIGRVQVYDPLKDTTDYLMLYSSHTLATFDETGNVVPLPVTGMDGFQLDEAIPLVVKPTPPKIGKPIDLTKNTGTFTSGDVTSRQTDDGQPSGSLISKDTVASVRFIRALQLSQGRVDTGRRRDEGIPTQVVGEAPVIFSANNQGSFSADVPANVPLQFQLLDKNGRVLVTHKPWLHIAPGATERCVGCHDTHDKPAVVQDLAARSIPARQVDTSKVIQYNFDQDIQPILNAKCVMCHDSAKVGGAAGRRRPLSLVGRETPARVTESFQALVARVSTNTFVVTQNSRKSELMWWLTGLKLDASPQTDYPVPAASVPHKDILTAEEVDKIAKWIDTGINFRVVKNDAVGATLSAMDDKNFTDTFKNKVYPILQSNGCVTCHSAGGQGEYAMRLDGIPEMQENQAQVEEEKLKQTAYRANFVIPEASLLLRKPEPPEVSGLTHMGGAHWTKDSADYKTIYAWIASANPAAAPTTIPTDLLNVNNYPNPFRDQTTFVYGLTGAAATKVDFKIYTQDGKLIRELDGTTTQGATIGYNKVTWDGKDKNGKVVGNDVYFYVVHAEFGDGTKKKFRGKCVKLN